MCAVGSLDKGYSINNIFMADMYPHANTAHDAYYTSIAFENRKNNSQKMAKDE